MARFLYDCKLNNRRIRWIPFNEFTNIEYLAKGGFGEVHKATWIDSYDHSVVLKRIYNSCNKITDILKEVKFDFVFIIIVPLNKTLHKFGI